MIVVISIVYTVFNHIWENTLLCRLAIKNVYKACNPTTSEDLVVVLEQRLKASTLLLQELQGFLLQQPGHLAHREASWGGGEEEGWKIRAKDRLTKEQEEACRCYIHQYINTLLQACTEIIFINRHTVRNKSPIQLIGLCWCLQLFWERSGNVLMLYTEHFTGGEEEKTPQSLSLSVSLGCEVCSIKAAPTSCQSDQHAFHCCISHRPSESVSHCRHSSHRDSNFRYQRAQKVDIEMHKATSLTDSKQMNDVRGAPPPSFTRFSVFLPLPF